MQPESAAGKFRCEATMERELRARGFHAADDAASLCGDFGISGAAEAPPEFVAPVAGEDDVCVGIHEAGDHSAAFSIDDDGIASQRAGVPPVRFGADEHDRAPMSGDGGFRNRDRIRLARSDSRRRTGAREDLGRVVNQEIGDHDALL